MHKSNRTAFLSIFHLSTDVIGLLLAYFVAYIITARFTTLSGVFNYSWVVLVYIPLWIFIMSINGMYNNTTFNYYDRIFRVVFSSSVFSSVFVAALMYAIKDRMFSRLLFFNYFILNFIIMLIVRYLALYVTKYYDNKNVRQAIVIGEDKLYEKFNNYIQKTDIKLKVISYLAVNNESDLISKEDFEEVLKFYVVDEIYFLLPINYFKEIQEYALICEEMGITSRVLLDIVETKFSKVNVARLGTLPMVTFHSTSMNKVQLGFKRTMDIVGAIVGILISSVFWIAASIAIKVESPGPIFFVQERVGKNGRLFKLYKFRSMCIDAEEKKKDLELDNEMSDGMMFKVKDDPRVTKVGKFIRKTSIDEIPQFLNVLKGEMSLVGTRPPTVEEVDKYKNSHRRRISIKPGITGMWQVSGRSEISDFDEVVNLDTKYIDEWSLWLDVKIILKTIKVVFAKRGAY